MTLDQRDSIASFSRSVLGQAPRRQHGEVIQAAEAWIQDLKAGEATLQDRVRAETLLYAIEAAKAAERAVWDKQSALQGAENSLQHHLRQLEAVFEMVSR